MFFLLILPSASSTLFRFMSFCLCTFYSVLLNDEGFSHYIIEQEKFIVFLCKLKPLLTMCKN